MLITILYFAISTSLTSSERICQHLDNKAICINEQRIDYDRLLTEIASYGIVECGVTGYRAVKSAQSTRYDTLLENSTDIQLYYFSNNSSPIVRVYAIQGLANRRSPYLKQVLEAHKNDNIQFTYRCGCERKTMPINLWIDLVLSKEI